MANNNLLPAPSNEKTYLIAGSAFLPIFYQLETLFYNSSLLIPVNLFDFQKNRSYVEQKSDASFNYKPFNSYQIFNLTSVYLYSQESIVTEKFLIDSLVVALNYNSVVAFDLNFSFNQSSVSLYSFEAIVQSKSINESLELSNSKLIARNSFSALLESKVFYAGNFESNSQILNVSPLNFVSFDTTSVGIPAAAYVVNASDYSTTNSLWQSIILAQSSYTFVYQPNVKFSLSSLSLYSVEKIVDTKSYYYSLLNLNSSQKTFSNYPNIKVSSLNIFAVSKFSRIPIKIQNSPEFILVANNPRNHSVIFNSVNLRIFGALAVNINPESRNFYLNAFSSLRETVNNELSSNSNYLTIISQGVVKNITDYTAAECIQRTQPIDITIHKEIYVGEHELVDLNMSFPNHTIKNISGNFRYTVINGVIYVRDTQTGRKTLEITFSEGGRVKYILEMKPYRYIL